jgi:hypothetical protein
MNQDIGLILGVRATSELATSALPCAPVRPVPHRRQRRTMHRLLSEVSGRGL